jgi:glycerol-3-phosphate cytidylyltransferase
MIRGVIAGNFDIVHPGYIRMFKECKEHCDHLTVLLHTDPSEERPTKLKPILTVSERMEILTAIEYVDSISIYNVESDLRDILRELAPNIRFLGDDYKDKKITGEELHIPIHYLDRSHGWSSTKFKQLIYEQIASGSI